MARNYLVITGFMLALGITGFTGCEKKMDRRELVQLMEEYLEALPGHIPSELPIADNVKLVENTRVAPIGKGLWKTATGGHTAFSIYVADPVGGQVAYMGVNQRENNWGPCCRQHIFLKSKMVKSVV